MEKKYKFSIRSLLDWFLAKKLMISTIIMFFLMMGIIFLLLIDQVKNMNSIIVFGMSGIITSFLIIMALYFLDKTIKTSKDISNYIGTEVISEIAIPRKKELILDKKVKEYRINEIESIRNNLSYSSKSKLAQTMLITSFTPKEGKDYIAFNLAISFAGMNQKVLIIDISKTEEKGFFECISELYENENEIFIVSKYINDTEINGLHVMTGGNEIVEDMYLQKAEKVMKLLKNMYDIIIVNGKSYDEVEGNIILSKLTDFTVMILKSNQDKISDIIDFKKKIEQIGGNLKGIILNKRFAKKLKYKRNNYELLKSGEEIKQSLLESNAITVKELVRKTEEKLQKQEYQNKQNKIKDKLYPQNLENVLKEETVEELKAEQQIVEKEKTIHENKEMKEEIRKQNEAIQKIKEQLEEMKIEMKHRIMKEKVKQEEINLQNELTLHIAKKIEKMIQLEENKEKSLLQKIEEGNKSEIQIVNTQLEELKQMYQEISDYMAQDNKKEEFENILKEKINQLEKEQKEILQEKLKEFNETEKIQDIHQQLDKMKDSYLEIEKVIEDKMQKAQENYQELLQEKIHEINYGEEIKNINAQIEKIDYTEQIEQINDTLINLKDSYLELSNQVKNKQEEIVDNDKIITIKSYQEKKKKGKKKFFILNEDITYESLEKTAQYVINLKNGTEE